MILKGNENKINLITNNSFILFIFIQFVIALQLSTVIGPCCNLDIVNCTLNRPKLTFQIERHIAGLNRHLLSNRPKSLLNLTKVLNSVIPHRVGQIGRSN